MKIETKYPPLYKEDFNFKKFDAHNPMKKEDKLCKQEEFVGEFSDIMARRCGATPTNYEAIRQYMTTQVGGAGLNVADTIHQKIIDEEMKKRSLRNEVIDPEEIAAKYQKPLTAGELKEYEDIYCPEPFRQDPKYSLYAVLGNMLYTSAASYVALKPDKRNKDKTKPYQKADNVLSGAIITPPKDSKERGKAQLTLSAQAQLLIQTGMNKKDFKYGLEQKAGKQIMKYNTKHGAAG